MGRWLYVETAQEHEERVNSTPAIGSEFMFPLALIVGGLLIGVVIKIVESF